MGGIAVLQRSAPVQIREFRDVRCVVSQDLLDLLEGRALTTNQVLRADLQDVSHLLMSMEIPTGRTEDKVARVPAVQNLEFDVPTIPKQVPDQLVVGLRHVSLVE